ncbi:MAG: hypothetical protein DRQ64_08695 [Gammaproteobacteria bacterium]|nr:MAG: hypothetical protein DRQ64_08695 [Gammaproteobacteria bacterium]
MSKKSELLENMRRLAGLKPLSEDEKARLDAEEIDLQESSHKSEEEEMDYDEKDKKSKKDSEEEEMDYDEKDKKSKASDGEEEEESCDSEEESDEKVAKKYDEEEEDSDYQVFFKKMLDQHGGSIADMSDEEKKEFFNKVEKAWNSEDEPGKDGVKESENPDKDRAAASVGTDMDIYLGDKEVVPSTIMVDMMESLLDITGGNTKEIAAVINEMVYEACASMESKYTALRDMINRGEVSKDMMVHEGTDGPVFGEKMDEAKMTEMYQGNHQDSMAAAGEAIMSFYAVEEGVDPDADKDSGVDKKVRDGDKKVADLKDTKKDDKLSKDKNKMTDKVTEGISIRERIEDARFLIAILNEK